MHQRPHSHLSAAPERRLFLSQVAVLRLDNLKVDALDIVSVTIDVPLHSVHANGTPATVHKARSGTITVDHVWAHPLGGPFLGVAVVVEVTVVVLGAARGQLFAIRTVDVEGDLADFDVVAVVHVQFDVDFFISPKERGKLQSLENRIGSAKVWILSLVICTLRPDAICEK